MHCIVTAGPTAEPLDEVRRLTNASTGRLGAGLADFLAGKGCRVTLLRSRLAMAHSRAAGLATEEFTTAAELEAVLGRLAEGSVAAIFHVAAVADFTFGSVYERTSSGSLLVREERKLGTTGRDLLVELKPTPKLIARFTDWFPQAWRVGWKYELDGGREQAIEAARAQIRRYRTHACVANGLAYGSGFGLVSVDGACGHCASVDELYAGLWETLRAFRARD